MKNGLDKIPGTSLIWDLHTILRIISRGVPGLATVCPFGVWGRGWTTCLLYDGTLLGLGSQLSVGVKNWYGGEWFSYWLHAFFHVLYITPIFLLAISFQLNWPSRRQAIIRTNVGILLIAPIWTNFNVIWMEIHIFHHENPFECIVWKMAAILSRPQCVKHT